MSYESQEFPRYETNYAQDEIKKKSMSQRDLQSLSQKRQEDKDQGLLTKRMNDSDLFK